ncbi:MAG: DRTGG domain-containing protein [Desulfobacterales bacterium]|jgi:predicted transcriptional regulator
MQVKDLVKKFKLQVAGGQKGLDREVSEGYCGDLLSEVMGNAPAGCAWMTVQGHQNIVAVAVLREMAAIVITGGQKPDAETIEKADQEGIPVLQYPDSSFRLAGRLFSAGVGNPPAE